MHDEPPPVRTARAALAREHRWEIAGLAAIVMGLGMLFAGLQLTKPFRALEGLEGPVIVLSAVLVLGGPTLAAAYGWVHKAALERARAQVDAWNAAEATQVVAAAGPSAGAAAWEAVAGPRWASAVPTVDALLGLDLPAPVLADVEAARIELRKTAATLDALDAVGVASDPENRRYQRRAAVTAGLVARFDALLGSLEELLLEQVALRNQADSPIDARVRDQVSRSAALREVESAVAGRDARPGRPAGALVRQA
ncbi:MAG: hypothetical protein CL927_06160 [Deltaproteobacteria bacterium]|nr:hypothetical protein [Deltaproteobacteria bacterium]